MILILNIPLLCAKYGLTSVGKTVFFFSSWKLVLLTDCHVFHNNMFFDIFRKTLHLIHG